MTLIKLFFYVIGLLLGLALYFSPVILIVIAVRYFIKKKKREQYKAYREAGAKANATKEPRKELSYEEWKAAKLGRNPEEYSMNSSQLGTNRLDLIKEHTHNHAAEPPKEEPKQEDPVPLWDSEILHTHPPINPIPKAEPRPERKDTGYEAVSILTPNEMANYNTLKAAADKKGYIVNLKARLADLVAPHKGPDYMSRFGKIKSKHVDFTILDSRLRTIAVIELDDSSHDRPDRIERDKFVDETLESCGIKVIHTRYITPDILDNI